jgi:hypothetical protein
MNGGIKTGPIEMPEESFFPNASMIFGKNRGNLIK